MNIIVPRELILIVAGGISSGRVHIIVVGGEKVKAESELFHLRGAFEPLCAGFAAGKGGQQQTGEDGNDRNDDQQFDQCKGSLEVTHINSYFTATFNSFWSITNF